MIAFLRWFPAFRALEARLADAGARIIVLEDELRHLRGRNEALADDARHARAESIEVLKQQVDAFASLVIRRHVHGTGVVAEMPPSEPIPPRGVQARLVQMQRTADFYNSLDENNSPA